MSIATPHTPSVLEDELLPPDRVAQILQVTTNTLAIWRYYRRGPSFLKIGSRVRYPRASLDEFMASAVVECDPVVTRRVGRR
ncbi:helix-turn-helix domain-containing protein [Microbacterium pumilum]|uniref:Helix-turn-helix domain-containing protein n=1 Tax=Microbacterium pumilum TaxID=344165 RepID=A0ABP5DGX1_9MICO